MKSRLDILTMPFNWLARFSAENSDFIWAASVVCVLPSGAKKEISKHYTAKTRPDLCDLLVTVISEIQIELTQQNINSCFHASFSPAEFGLCQLVQVFLVPIEYFIFTSVI